LLYIILIEIGENKHLGNNSWAGDNSSIISSLLKKNSRTFKDLIIFQGLSRPGFFFYKFKDFPGFSRTVGTLFRAFYLVSDDTSLKNH
jgi:hypothetical protein